MTASHSKSLLQAIKAQAERLGFQLFGVATPDPPPHIEAYQRWLDASFHGEMEYLATERARQRRADPRLILPGCRSIMVLGIRYPSSPRISSSSPLPSLSSVRTPPPNLSPFSAQPSPPIPTISAPSSAQPSPPLPPITAPSSAQSSPLYGRVSSYAWGTDYHHVLEERLAQLVLFIEAQAGSPLQNRWYTDTGPLLERDLAQRAGLGWIGKNTCLIHPRQGSYFFLAEILLDLEIKPDEPFVPDYCGDCTRCLEACPTGCILPNRTIDSRRCISYLTIELKGVIPLELRPRVGDWVFGCDLCQQVCPWNERFASLDVDPAFDPRSGIPHPVLLPEFSLSPQAFNLKFKGSPIQRARRRGYLRNTAVVLGNIGGPVAVPSLLQVVLHEPEPLVRGHAAWALGRIGDSSARKGLNAALHTEQDAYVVKEIREALEISC